jgi:hypothetical protein
MIQLKILSGKMAGTEMVARRFPFRIGRAASANLRVEEDGVWDDHLELGFEPGTGYVLTARPSALAGINGQQVTQAVLRNGDLIEIGALKMRFWLAETRQAGMRWREWLTWTGIALVTAGQVWLVYRLGR